MARTFKQKVYRDKTGKFISSAKASKVKSSKQTLTIPIYAR
jgi:hypothetical protein